MDEEIIITVNGVRKTEAEKSISDIISKCGRGPVMSWLEKHFKSPWQNVKHMATEKGKIESWLFEAPKEATHMAIICNTFNYDDFPVYILEGQDVKNELDKYINNENKKRLMEVYNLKMDIEPQLSVTRAMNY